MARKSAKRDSKPAPPKRAARETDAGRVLERLLVGGFVAACVARPLVPCEGVSWLGDGHAFTMLLLLLTAGYLVLAVRRGGFTRRVHLVDVAVAALVMIAVTSATLGVLTTLFDFGASAELEMRVSNPRLATNMLWEWVGLGLVYFLARQLVAEWSDARALVVVMIALGVVLSAYGLWQVFVSLPAERAAYAADPDEALRRLGQWFPPGSPERARFEDRLNSTEPLATFALTNSLAGYLAAWLVLALGVAWGFVRQLAGDRWRMARVAALAASIAVMLACLVLTKSRTAYLAMALGLVLLPLLNPDWRRMLNWRWLAAAGLVLAIFVAAAVAVGGVDANVLTEAHKSLGYRWEYWQATLDMISQFPILGVGPGDFQNYYTQYKLPEASEEIRDPHNFLLEVWSTAGTFAFLALTVVLAGFAWQTWELADSDVGDNPGEAKPSPAAMYAAACGGAAGVLFAYFAGLPFGFVLGAGQIVAALVLGAAVVATLWPWIAGGTLPPRLPALGVAVLAVHWLAAGGFSFPGVAETFWILLALGINQGRISTVPAPASGFWQRLGPVVGLALVVVALVACYNTAFLPVLRTRAALAEAEDARLTDEERAELLVSAEAADPFSADAATALAELCMKNLRKDPDSETWGRRFLDVTATIVTLNGHSSAAWRQIAEWYRELYAIDPSPEIADRIRQLARGAAILYPNSAAIQAEYAVALEEFGNHKEARRVAALALELDGRTPHKDKKLSDSLKSRVAALAAADDAPQAP
jgi:hypothetical protein